MLERAWTVSTSSHVSARKVSPVLAVSTVSILHRFLSNNSEVNYLKQITMKGFDIVIYFDAIPLCANLSRPNEMLSLIDKVSREHEHSKYHPIVQRPVWNKTHMGRINERNTSKEIPRRIVAEHLAKYDFRFPECDAVDVVLALDTSDSFGKRNFYKVLAFTKDIISNLNIDGVAPRSRVGLETFSSHVSVKFHLNAYSKVDDVRSAISYPYRGGDTNTALALQVDMNLLAEVYQHSINKNNVTELFGFLPTVTTEIIVLNQAKPIGNYLVLHSAL